MQTALLIVTTVCLFGTVVTMMWGLARRIDGRSDMAPMMWTFALFILGVVLGVTSTLV